MNSVSADVILLSETNLLWKDYNVFKQTSDHRRNLFSHPRQNTSFSTKHYGSPYQPGGTCSVLTNSIVGHYHSSPKDSLLGRWNITNLNVPGGKVLSIISCYQTCHNNSTTTARPKTFFMQQWSKYHKSSSMTAILSQYRHRLVYPTSQWQLHHPSRWLQRITWRRWWTRLNRHQTWSIRFYCTPTWTLHYHYLLLWIKMSWLHIC